MLRPVEFVRKSELVTSHFGTWPSFHDSEVLRVELERADACLLISLRAFEMSNAIDQKGNFRREKLCRIVLKFSQVDKLRLEDFNEQNVISELVIEKQSNNVEIAVSLRSSYGLSGSFVCRAAEVLCVEPIREEE